MRPDILFCDKRESNERNTHFKAVHISAIAYLRSKIKVSPGSYVTAIEQHFVSEAPR